MKRCSKCGGRKRPEDFGRNRARHDGLDVYCRPCKSADYSRREQSYRHAALDALGGRCAHCGIDDYRVLCIDHVNGGGTQERKSGKKQLSFYRAVSMDTHGFQALCWNCNWIKRLETDGKVTMTFTLTPS